MPYVQVIIARRHENVFGDKTMSTQLSDDIRSIIAGAYRSFCAEVLDPDEDIILPNFQFSSSMPADLTIVVTTWWTNQRAFKFHKIQHYIASYLLYRYLQLSAISVFVNAVSDPFAMSVQELLTTYSGPLRMRVLHILAQHDIETVAELCAFSMDQLRSWTGMGVRAQQLIYEALRARNLSLAGD